MYAMTKYRKVPLHQYLQLRLINILTVKSNNVLI